MSPVLQCTRPVQHSEGPGWGLLSQFSTFRYFPNFSTSPKYMPTIEYHVDIWQVSPQLSCGDTCQIWMWFKECNRIENFAYRDIDRRSCSNPHPSLVGESGSLVSMAQGHRSSFIKGCLPHGVQCSPINYTQGFVFLCFVVVISVIFSGLTSFPRFFRVVSLPLGMWYL